MTIFLISNMYPSKTQPYYGSFVKGFYDGLNSKGHNLQTDALIRGRTNNIFLKLWKYIVFYFEILFKGLCYKYDIIYVHTVSHTAMPLLLLGFFRSYKLVINPHGGDVIAVNPFEKKMRYFVQKLIDKAQLVVAPSHFFKDYMVKEFKTNEQKIFVSASAGIDIEKFAIKNISTTAANKVFEIGFVSRIDKGKGWDVLVYAVDEIVKRKLIPEFNCTIAGYGNEIEAMLSLINELNLTHIIKYIGPKSHAELPLLYINFDIFVFPTTLSESLGLVGLEAMACGVPVIGAELGGIRDYLIDNYNGLFFTPGDAQDLTAKIYKFYNLDFNSRRKMSANARNTALNYNNIKIIDDLSDKLQNVFK
jgi:glycosyltransferase involved in cell wall biosynthesis